MEVKINGHTLVNLSVFTRFLLQSLRMASRESVTEERSACEFDGERVGLSIVAAMADESSGEVVVSRSIPIVSVGSQHGEVAEKTGVRWKESDDASQSHASVTRRFANNGVVTKRVYFCDEEEEDEEECGGSIMFVSGWPMEAERGETWSSEVLEVCFLCQKDLRGKDVHMYRYCDLRSSPCWPTD